MKIVTLALVLASIFSLSPGLPRTCCRPPRLEGRRFLVESQTVKYFAADYDLGRVYESRNPEGDIFDIIDINRNRLFVFNGSDCRYRQLSQNGYSLQCITDLGADPFFFDLGMTDDGHRVYAFLTGTGDDIAYELVTGTVEFCFPFYSRYAEGYGGNVASFYSNLNSTITQVSTDQLNVSLDHCVEMDFKLL